MFPKRALNSCRLMARERPFLVPLSLSETLSFSNRQFFPLLTSLVLSHFGFFLEPRSDVVGVDKGKRFPGRENNIDFALLNARADAHACSAVSAFRSRWEKVVLAAARSTSVNFWVRRIVYGSQFPRRRKIAFRNEWKAVNCDWFFEFASRVVNVFQSSKLVYSFWWNN